MKYILILAIAATSATGCSTLNRDDYSPGTADKDEFTRDAAKCEMIASQSSHSGGMGGVAGSLSQRDTYDRVFDPCMRSKGYIKK